MGERDLARPRRVAAADQARPVEIVWCGARNGRRPAIAASTGRPQALATRAASIASAGVERRQDRGQAPRRHRLAGARRPGDQQAVAAGGGDLERPAQAGLAAQVGEVGQRLATVSRRVQAAAAGAGSRSPPSSPSCSRRSSRDHAPGSDQRGLGPARRRDDDRPRPGAGGGLGHRHRPGDRSQRAVERQLAGEGEVGQRRGVELARSRQAPPRRSRGRSRGPPCAGRPGRGSP